MELKINNDNINKITLTSINGYLLLRSCEHVYWIKGSFPIVRARDRSNEANISQVISRKQSIITPIEI